jgi:hypothetical protein
VLQCTSDKASAFRCADGAVQVLTCAGGCTPKPGADAICPRAAGPGLGDPTQGGAPGTSPPASPAASSGDSGGCSAGRDMGAGGSTSGLALGLALAASALARRRRRA